MRVKEESAESSQRKLLDAHAVPGSLLTVIKSYSAVLSKWLLTP